MHTYINEKYKKSSDLTIKYALESRDFGICTWNISKNEVNISEEITGYKLYNINSLVGFINKIVYGKDKDIALQELDDYIMDAVKTYQSTFRIKTTSGEIKWLLFSGKIIIDKVTKDRILNVVIFDITGEKARGSQDSLSNLLRGNFLIRKIKNSIKSAEGRNGKGGLVYIEIDNFKNLVSSYGGKMGDIILKLVFQSINDVISTNDELVKLVGDKFIILINDFNTIDEVEEICNKIFKNHKQPLIIGNNLINIVFNVGVSIFPDDSTDVDELIQISEFTKEQSKVKGKNILTFFGKKESEVFYRKEIIERELSNGIPNKEFHLCYQPRFEVSSNKIAGVEVLLRWNNKKVGNISPGEFISIAEKNGFIIEIGEWVLEESLKVASMWLSSGYEFKAISVNISLVQLTNKTFKNKLINLCKKHQIPHSILEIEIAERVLMEICDTNIKIINELIEEGFRISLDDFGTGYSNISSLLDIHCSSLKIDKSIIDKIGKDRNKLAIKSIIDLKEDLNYEVIAEGVETKEQVDILTDLGCNIIQGYYFSKPLSEKEIENLLQATSCIKKLIKD